jgi:periplasmic divalent cation tolerance protein
MRVSHKNQQMEANITEPVAMIMTTVKDRDEARSLAGILIETRAAACVQEIAIHSHYRWEGKTESAPEILLLVKTAHDRVDFAIETIKSNHAYQVPEILVVPIAGGLASYLQWVKDETHLKQQ